MKKNNLNAFSLVIAIFLMLICNIIAIYLLQYVIPFFKNTKGMEFGVAAYYEAYSGIEDLLYNMKGKDAYYETGKTMPSSAVGYSYSLISTGNTIPSAGEGTSDYNGNYNAISISQPTQLLLKGAINWAQTNFVFKVPNLDGSGTTIETLSGSTIPYINWKLSSNGGSLTCSGSYILGSNINPSNGTTAIKLNNRIGYLLDGHQTQQNFQTFYTNNNCALSGCTLKLYVLNNLETINGTQIPYLEYRIVFPVGTYVANYYAKVSAAGKTTGYKKDIDFYVPQQTTIGAFDFTIFQ
ncbi:MAG: hypothetical protein PHN31_05720 [Candidatus Gracilibacteria bacterium]|nr:hypothetical protein [Candidatus Gracilibacteria bacterium]